LDGGVRAARGVLPIALACRRQRIGTLLMPAANGCEAAVVEGVRTLSVRTLRETVGLLNSEQSAAPAAPTSAVRPGDGEDVDFSEVRG
jgi:magnesium chelatase family protein